MTFVGGPGEGWDEGFQPHFPASPCTTSVLCPKELLEQLLVFPFSVYLVIQLSLDKTIVGAVRQDTQTSTST